MRPREHIIDGIRERERRRRKVVAAGEGLEWSGRGEGVVNEGRKGSTEERRASTGAHSVHSG